ncbi:Pentatricopeptide repeat (PPR) superfamily protein [Salix suchowensis]|nr:Pentatricopeptide repeat (PPR) superfamily protein [Salix suchowensis]
MVIAAAVGAASSLPLGISHCQLCKADRICCSTSYGFTNGWIKSPITSCRSCVLSSIRNPFLGSTQFQWSSVNRELCLLKVSVAADYSDSAPDSSNHTSHQGYHPLEEVKNSKRTRETQLTSAEIARTTVEANTSALLVFPGSVHCEPHKQVSWTEFQYIIDEYGGYLKIHTWGDFQGHCPALNQKQYSTINVLIGMDIPIYENKKVANEYNIFNIGIEDDIPFDEDYFEVTMDSEVPEVSVDWGMPDTFSLVHPIYFSKCMTKAINMEYYRKMDHPSNGVSIVGCLRPSFADEESYLRRSFHIEDRDGYNSDWKAPKRWKQLWLNSPPFGDLENRAIFVYVVSLQDFQDAEPDVLAHSTSAILEHFSEKGKRYNVALKALCKKKGLHVEDGPNRVSSHLFFYSSKD